MAENMAILRQKQAKAEQDYDALVTQLNRCQGQLGAKQAQAQKLSPPEYQKWFVDKKQEHADIVSKLQKQKQIRAEVRRMFNSWQPQQKEEWKPSPRKLNREFNSSTRRTNLLLMPAEFL